MKLRDLRTFLEKQNPHADVMIRIYDSEFQYYCVVPVKSVHVIMKEGVDDISYDFVLSEEEGD